MNKINYIKKIKNKNSKPPPPPSIIPDLIKKIF